jgi:sporulation protein YlmC with PRC-barrel domain
VRLVNNKVDMKKQFFILGTAAALTAWVPSMNAAEAEVKADVDVPKVETRTEVKRDHDTDVTVDAKTDREKIRRTNKASGLIGMEVRNAENQKLGEVKDLVMDMNSGRVSYAVLSVGGFLGIGEKLIALPPGALKATDAGDHLVLNADKAKIQAAPGFAATSWPAPGDPQINQFWSDLKATGSPASTETRRSGDVDVDIHKKDGKIEVDTDRTENKKIYTDADKDKKVKVEVEKE